MYIRGFRLGRARNGDRGGDCRYSPRMSDNTDGNLRQGGRRL